MVEEPIRDLLWFSVLEERKAVAQDALAHAREAVAEMRTHGIEKPLFSVLLDKGLIRRDMAKDVGAAIAACGCVCAHCRCRVTLAGLDRHDQVRCSRCEGLSRVRFDAGKGPIASRITAERVDRTSGGDSKALRRAAGGLPPAGSADATPPRPLHAVEPSTHAERRAPSFAPSAASARKAGAQQRAQALRARLRYAPFIAVGVSSLLCVCGMTLLGGRYVAWAGESTGFTGEALVAAASEYAYRELVAAKGIAQPDAYARDLALYASAYAGTEAGARIAALAAAERVHAPASRSEAERITDAAALGDFDLALRRLAKASLSAGDAHDVRRALAGEARGRGLCLLCAPPVEAPGRAPVYAGPVLIDLRPVTNREYLEYVRRNNALVPLGWTGAQIPAGKEDAPVTGISHKEAHTYARWAGRRLPREGELKALAPDASWEGREWVDAGESAGAPHYPLAVRRTDAGFAYRRFHVHMRPADVTFRCVQPLAGGRR